MPEKLTVVVSANTVYAARQHEETTWKHPRGGKAKYLSDPLKANADRYARALNAAVEKVLREIQAEGLDVGLADKVKREALIPWATAVGLHLQGEGSRSAPIETGLLRGSVTYEVLDGGGVIDSGASMTIRRGPNA